MLETAGVRHWACERIPPGKQLLPYPSLSLSLSPTPTLTLSLTPTLTLTLTPTLTLTLTHAPGGSRNISNGLSIRTGDHISTSVGLEQLCQQRGWWDGEGPFDWKRALSGGGGHASLGVCGREKAGQQHLATMAAAAAAGELGAGNARGWLERMAAVLRDETSGICFRDLHGFTSTGSQLSWIPPPGEQASHLTLPNPNPNPNPKPNPEP